jgi:hypothetical protein
MTNRRLVVFFKALRRIGTRLAIPLHHDIRNSAVYQSGKCIRVDLEYRLKCLVGILRLIHFEVLHSELIQCKRERRILFDRKLQFLDCRLVIILLASSAGSIEMSDGTLGNIRKLRI